MKSQSGFSLLEAIVVLGLAALAYLFFFRIVTIFLQTRGEHLVRQDILSTSDTILNRFTTASQNATKLDVAPNGYELKITGNPCALFSFNPTTKKLGYGEDSTPNCAPPLATSVDLNTNPVEVTSLTFSPIATPSSAKSVRLTFTLYSQQPFATRSATYTSAVTLWRQ